MIFLCLTRSFERYFKDYRTGSEDLLDVSTVILCCFSRSFLGYFEVYRTVIRFKGPYIRMEMEDKLNHHPKKFNNEIIQSLKAIIVRES